MIKWEYAMLQISQESASITIPGKCKIIYDKYGKTQKGLKEQPNYYEVLNDLGTDGWEMFIKESNGTYWTSYWLKRPIE